MMYRLLPALLLAGSALAQRSEPSIFGYLPDEQGRVRALHGLPGASHLGAPATPLADVQRTLLAPGQEYALIQRADQPQLSLLLLSGGTEPVAIADSWADCDRAVFSPRATSAALYSAARGRIQLLTGLPGEPRVLADVAAGNVRSLAIDDDATQVLIGWGADPGTVQRVSRSGERQTLLAVAEPTGLQFLPGSGDALVVDRSRHELHLLSGAEARLLASSAQGLAHPHLAVATDDAARVIVANENGGLVLVDRGTGAARAVDTSAAPASLLRLRRRGTYLLSPAGAVPAWILDLRADGAEVLFVPALTETEAR